MPGKNLEYYLDSKHFNEKDKYGETELMRAVFHPERGGDIKALLDAKADTDCQNEDGYTALMLAAMTGNAQSAFDLIKAGADLNKQDNKRSYTALSLAMSYGRLDCAQLLIEAGASLELPENNLKPLEYATKFGKKDLIRCLQSHGAEAKDSSVSTKHSSEDYHALIHAAKAGNLYSIRYAIETKHDNIDQQDSSGNTALTTAILQGRTDCAKFLIESGANIELPENNTPLQCAIAQKNVEIINLLLNRGAIFVNQFNLLNTLPMGCGRSFVDRLVKAGTINEQNSEGDTALIYAAKTGKTAYVRHLLAKGADFKKNNYFGDTAMAVAIMSEHPDCTTLLIEAGADRQSESDYSYENHNRYSMFKPSKREIENKKETTGPEVLDAIGGAVLWGICACLDLSIGNIPAGCCKDDNDSVTPGRGL